MALVDGPMTVSDISEAFGKERNGHLSNVLDELTLSGFVERDVGLNPKTGRTALATRYRLKDNYVRFYLKYIEPNRLMIDRDGYRFVSLEQLDGWNAVLGLQFENLILNHLQELLTALNIESNWLTSAAPYRFVPRKRGEGVQIDLLIQARRFWYVVEIKRKRTIGREVIDEVDRKVSRLPHPRSVSIRTALVYEGELSSLVSGEGYFDAIIPVEAILGMGD